MLKIIGIGAALLVGGVLLAAATRPNEFRVQRTASIQAAPEKIFPHINDLRRFNTWNPFEKKDPNLKGSYSGAASGAGAAYAFEGNKDVGRGRIEITGSSPGSEVRMKLDFLSPFEAHNFVEFTLRPKGDSTSVTWAIHGPMPFVSKLFSMFCDMDAMIGKEFEQGLAELKSIVES
jgi:polyketide cyclase/dehydrase/lipid transport protein